MPNPFSGDTTTTGARAGNAAYNELQSLQNSEDDAIIAISGSIGGGVISKISETAGDSGGTNVEEHFVPPPSAAIPDYQGIQQKKFNDIKTTVIALDDNFEREYIDKINHKKNEIVTLSGQLFALVNQTGVNYPTASERLAITTAAAFGDTAENAVYMAGISTFIYPTGCDSDSGTCIPNVDCCLVGVKGTVYPDILAASHFPNLSSGTQSASGILPAGENDRTFIRVSRSTSGSGAYASSTLGIGQTLYASNDANYHGAVGVVTSQTEIGTYYFFDDASQVNSGYASSITSIMSEITTLRSDLNSKITDNARALRERKHQEELNTWFMDAGYRIDSVKDYQSGMNALEDSDIADPIKAYDG